MARADCSLPTPLFIRQYKYVSVPSEQEFATCLGMLVAAVGH